MSRTVNAVQNRREHAGGCEALNPKLPACISRLDELAMNLWWSWRPHARDLFRALDYQLWVLSGHNPVKQIRDISPYKLQSAAADPAFLEHYDSVVAEYEKAMTAEKTWFTTNYPEGLSGPVAFFSMEFAIHNSLPIYAGGLGILAGDICKEASDIGLPLVGVGFMYPHGYFHQRISPDGWQGEISRHIDFYEAPIKPILTADGRKPVVSVRLADRDVHIGVWKLQVGRTPVYLLDTDIEENSSEDRTLSSHLYIADPEVRIQQEVILGIGGVRVLRALGIQPSVWHANEGHIAFMALERIREIVEQKLPYGEAERHVRATSVFTTHTPVPAGHDVFPDGLVEKYLKPHWASMGLDRERLLKLGKTDGHDDGKFNMTVLAAKTSDHRNAVSELHGVVSRRMWHSLWPKLSEDEVPITHITNGVHAPTWVAPDMASLFAEYLGADWWTRQDGFEMWDAVQHIPDNELWQARQLMKRKLLSIIHDQVQKGWETGALAAEQVPAMGSLLNQGVLTIGFVRRFASYKRPALIFHDIDRLKKIVNDPWRPVQIVFAGKSHPADLPGKELLHHVYSLAADREFGGRIAFVEDFNMFTARYLVHGIDVWLNVPRRLQEASGTSGMKASFNGVPHLSILDGWWREAYNGSNGWAIGREEPFEDPYDEDCCDAESLYRLLEEEIIPLYYNRTRDGVPHGWIHVVKEAIRTVGPQFCAKRMMREYVERMYVPASSVAVEHQGQPESPQKRRQGARKREPVLV